MARSAAQLLFVTLSVLFLVGCASSQRSPFIGAEPEEGSVQTRAPRTLRLYFRELPDVERSELVMTGSDGRMLNLRGMHTMGADDLMIEINDSVPNGEYTVRWKTSFDSDAAVHEGSYRFSVQAN